MRGGVGAAPLIRTRAGALAAWAAAASLSACAVEAPPPGGAPDLAPPAVRESAPRDGATRVDSLAAISFTFDEPMKRRTAERAVTVVPPVRWARIRWSGSRLELLPAEALRPATTYVVLLGGRAQDAHGNRLAAAHRTAFTTGDSLPEGIVTGRVKPVLGGRLPLVFALAPDAAGDGAGGVPSLDVARAVSVAEADTGGAFLLPHLTGGAEYWIVAYTDRNDNGAFDVEEPEPWGWHPLMVRARAGSASASGDSAIALAQFDPQGQGAWRGRLRAPDDPAGAPRALLVTAAEGDSAASSALAPQGADGSFLWPLAGGRYRGGTFRDMDGDGSWDREAGEPVSWMADGFEIVPAGITSPVLLDAPPPPPPASPAAEGDTTRADSTGARPEE